LRLGAVEHGNGANELHCAFDRNDAVCRHDVVVPAMRQGVAMRTPKSVPPSDERPTRRDLFFFYLSELEQMIERGEVEWDAQSAKAAQHRLAKLFMVLPNPATGTEGY
jgi:hypothetical protein